MTYATIKLVDPRAQVVLGRLALVDQEGRTRSAFLNQILANPDHPAGASFDIAAMHFYLTPRSGAGTGG